MCVWVGGGWGGHRISQSWDGAIQITLTKIYQPPPPLMNFFLSLWSLIKIFLVLMVNELFLQLNYFWAWSFSLMVFFLRDIITFFSNKMHIPQQMMVFPYTTGVRYCNDSQFYNYKWTLSKCQKMKSPFELRLS